MGYDRGDSVSDDYFNQMEFNLFQNQKENCHHDHIPFNIKRIGNIVFSVCVKLNIWFLSLTVLGFWAENFGVFRESGDKFCRDGGCDLVVVVELGGGATTALVLDPQTPTGDPQFCDVVFPTIIRREAFGNIIEKLLFERIYSNSNYFIWNQFTAMESAFIPY